MAADLSGYKVNNGEASSSAKFDSLIDAVQDALNSLGDTSKTGWGAGQILALSQLSQSSAVSGQLPVWNGSAWAAANPALSSLGQSGAAVNDVPTWSGSAWVPSAAASSGAPTLYVKTTEKDVVSTTTATDLFNGEITVGANKMSTTGAIKIWAAGDYLNNTTAARGFTLSLNLGSTEIWSANSGSANFTLSAVRRAWSFQAVIQALSSASSQRVGGSFVLGSYTPAAATGTGGISLDVAAPLLGIASSVNTTSAQALTLKVTHSFSSASLSMRCEYARVEVT